MAAWALLAAGDGHAQEPPPPAPPARPPLLHAPGAVAPGGRLELWTRGVVRPARVEQETGDGWITRGAPITNSGQRVHFRAPSEPGVLRLRARGADGGLTPVRRIRVRPLLLSAVGDVNFGNGPGARIDRHGVNWPWASVGRHLRGADLAVANLECAVSLRGSAQEKQYTFRGRPSALRAAAQAGGLDAVSLANNHSGDFGRAALLDTLRYARSYGAQPSAPARRSAAPIAPW